MIKKLLSIALIGVISTVSLVGCQPSKKETENKETFPNKQITMVVQANPGGLSDQISRTIAGLMEKDLGVPVVPVYKPGGSGAVGMSFVEASAPDGYTIGHAPIEISMLKSLGYANIGPDSITMLGRAYTTMAAITVAADSKWNTVEEFIEYAKANPGKIKVGNAGTGSVWHLAALGLEEKTGMKFNHVPFEGAGPAVAALMGGHVDAVMVAPIEVTSGVQGGKLKVLAVMGEKRSDAFKDVPTLKEKGIEYSSLHWGGFIAPKNLPDDVKTKLEASLQKAVTSDEFKKFVEERGMAAEYMASKEFYDFAKAQSTLFDELIPKSGIKNK